MAEEIPILDNVLSSGAMVYFTDKFRKMVEDHLVYIRTTERLTSTRVITSDDHQKLLRYRGDWFGFLQAINIPPKYHWAILRVNGIRDPLSLDTDLVALLLPDYSFIDKLAQLCKEKKK